MNNVTNEQFEKAYKDKDNLGIINYVCSKYYKFLPLGNDAKDEIKACGQRALWKCLAKHIEGKQKFTSSLYRFVNWECKALAQKLRRQNKNFSQIPVETKMSLCEKHKFSYRNMVDTRVLTEGLMLLDPDSKKLIEDYYLNNKTYNEISVENGYSTETARKRVKNAINKLKELCV